MVINCNLMLFIWPEFGSFHKRGYLTNLYSYGHLLVVTGYFYGI